jgi:beta-phosphoglucomutase
MIKACIFDLDGVIVDTAKYHFQAWRRLANELGFDFSEADNEQLKGVSRMESLDIILGWGGIVLSAGQKLELAERKNEWYKDLISHMQSNEILPGVPAFLDDLQRHDIRIALGSASKNAGAVIQSIGLKGRFETVVDGHQTTRSKPDPQVFQLAAQNIGLPPSACIVFEDADSGIEAALAGGFYAVGIGSPEILGKAHMVIPGFDGITWSDVLNALK